LSFLQVAEVGGISKLIVAEDPAFEGFLAEKLAPVLLASQSQFNFTHIIAGASAFSRYHQDNRHLFMIL
jgi:electron transfer flavoprotein alpha subunit